MYRILFVVVVNGGYSPWSDWTPCTVTCGGGESIRTRQCTNPSPEFGGKDCSYLGASTETLKCRNDPCPGKSFFFSVIRSTLKMCLLFRQVISTDNSINHSAVPG